jgi:Helix-turn-helix domain
MNHHSKHTAFYQVSTFITKKKHIKFNLISSEIIILWTIARYLDMPKGQCFAKQTTLAKECGLSLATFKRSCQKLADLKIIIRTTKKKIYNYYFGLPVTNVDEF